MLVACLGTPSKNISRQKLWLPKIRFVSIAFSNQISVKTGKQELSVQKILQFQVFFRHVAICMIPKMFKLNLKINFMILWKSKTVTLATFKIDHERFLRKFQKNKNILKLNSVQHKYCLCNTATSITRRSIPERRATAWLQCYQMNK